jgi:hypothetical protein
MADCVVAKVKVAGANLVFCSDFVGPEQVASALFVLRVGLAGSRSS